MQVRTPLKGPTRASLNCQRGWSRPGAEQWEVVDQRCTVVADYRTRPREADRNGTGTGLVGGARRAEGDRVDVHTATQGRQCPGLEKTLELMARQTERTCLSHGEHTEPVISARWQTGHQQMVGQRRCSREPFLNILWTWTARGSGWGRH
jgi:hypothetical protein